MAKKKKKARSAAPSLAPDRLTELTSALAEGALGDASEGEAVALAEHLAKASDVDALAQLRSLARTKAEEKAVKKALYVLRAQGIEVPEERPRGISLAPAESSLVVLMAPPSKDGTRIYSVCQPRRNEVSIIEAYFRVPQGLYRLSENKAALPAYKQWERRMLQSHNPNGLPTRVKVDGALWQRKQVEIRRVMRTGELGPEVDRNLAERTRARGGVEYDHPAVALDLSRGAILSVAQLAEAPHRLDVFQHTGAQARMQSQFEDEFGNEFIRTSVDEGERDKIMRKSGADMLSQWGMERAVETMLDSAIYYAAAGDLDAARTFVETATGKNKADKIRRFVEEYILWRFGDV